ncbi:HisA/HisF-related TIM barrel protein [Limnoglobus roseus]|uniref:1-(5-phosphoribosyl)-5-[(5-phosphoribosylamino)methylideneamino]imidazole-4-carboxamide isomerase n=1 Tax=Limnoglobus roseus TaxID=2598579 RepID=A0A5C1A8Z0_9BACT|nr:HisA/HisF-related TIM barrel protein [Limnoglobus roseus]QEL13578.1 1-(5-phosphoribosyl)-5-[(5- phosphoribosylamino)methylideneamino]imidazole-4- carboxamide isomerase [Limnoglobus roseus]
MRIIPVLDILGGEVVRAVGGRRDEYRPVVSRITASTLPLQVATDLLAATRATELYVADLDAIRGQHDSLSPAVVEFLNAVTVPVWLDFGVRTSADVRLVPANARPIVGTETAWDSGVASAFRHHAAGCAVSIDLFDGSLLGRWKKWGVQSPRDVLGVAAAAVAMGVPTLIVLDLASVGTGEGPRTLETCRAIRERFPKVELLTGGGVRSRADIDRLGDVGVDGVLVASALHDALI